MVRSSATDNEPIEPEVPVSHIPLVTLLPSTYYVHIKTLSGGSDRFDAWCDSTGGDDTGVSIAPTLGTDEERSPTHSCLYNDRDASHFILPFISNSNHSNPLINNNTNHSPPPHHDDTEWASTRHVDISTADMDAPLLAGLLRYAPELAAATLSAKGTDTKPPNEMANEMATHVKAFGEVSSLYVSGVLCVRGSAMEFLTRRMHSASLLYPQLHLAQQQQQQQQRQQEEMFASSSSTALRWFLRHHRQAACTMLSMGLSFLLQLEESQLRWKKALELPITSLQLLANVSYRTRCANSTETPPSDVTGCPLCCHLDRGGPREQLRTMAASLLACWKLAEVDANVTDLLHLLDRAFFHPHRRVLGEREVLQEERHVLAVCALHVETPRWWTLATELLTSRHASETVGERPHALEANVQYIARLERLLLGARRLLTGLQAGGETMEGWMAHHPLFGPAMVLASGALELEWVGAKLMPLANGKGGASADMQHADLAARDELCRLADAMRQVLS